MSLQGQDKDGSPITLHAAPLVLWLMPASVIAGLPVDETVARRIQEVTSSSSKAAYLQRKVSEETGRWRT